MRSYVWMVAVTTIIAVLGTILSYYFDWGLTGTSTFIIIAAIFNLIAYFFSDKIILRATGAKPITREHVPQLFTIVERLCQEARLPMPALYLIEERSMNAFATGRNHEHSAIAVTRGLLEHMTPDEIEGVVAHEISHILNYDMRLAAIVSVLVGFVSLLADMYWASSIMSRAEEEDKSGWVAIVGLALAVAAPLTAFLIQMALSRQREFLADATGASVCHKPRALASALKKISHDIRFPAHISPATAHLYFSAPNRDSVLERLFASHPPIEERIHALEQL